MASLTLRAFAKINLSLRITAVRADGFHDVHTLLQAIDLFDRVKCETRRGPFEIRCDMPGRADRPPEPRLEGRAVAVGRSRPRRRAARRPRHAAKADSDDGGPRRRQQRCRGGAPRAAPAVEAARAATSGSTRSRPRLGSDVPFFLVGGTALGLGRGDELYPLANLPRYWVVLAIPPFGDCNA